MSTLNMMSFLLVRDGSSSCHLRSARVNESKPLRGDVPLVHTRVAPQSMAMVGDAALLSLVGARESGDQTARTVVRVACLLW
jgi:hypothetical protein